MSAPRELMVRMLGVCEGEVSKLEGVSKERALLSDEAEMLCKYMGVVRHLVGVDLGSGEDFGELSEEELNELLERYGAERKGVKG